MKNITIILTMLLLASSYALADRVISPWFKIVEAGPDGNGPFVAKPSAGVANECTLGFNFWVGQSGMNEAGYQSAVSAVMAAFMADREVRVEYENSTSACYVYRMRIR